MLLIASQLPLFAQPITQTKAIEVAHQLFEKRLLNEKGRDELLKRIQQGRLRSFNGYELGGTIYEYKGLSSAALLNFCEEAFQGEFNYRSGMGMLPKDYQKYQKQIEKLFEKYKGDTTAVKEYLLKSAPKQFRIEFSIPAEDSIILQQRNSLQLPARMENNWIHESRSTWGKTRTRTARDLYEVGLLEEKVYQDVLQALRDSSLRIEEEVCSYASARSIHYTTYTENKAEQVRLLDTLRLAGVLSQKGYQQVLASYAPYELKSRFDFLPYCEKALVLDTRNYSKDPKVFYPLIMKEVQRLLPEFKYQELLVDLTRTDDGGDLIRYDATLSFTVNGVRYSHNFFHDYDRKDGQDFAPHQGADVSEEFHKPINKWLADQDSPYRLYFANKRGEYAVYGDEGFGLILMTQAQSQVWGQEMYFLSAENHDNRFNTKNIEKLVAYYQQLGLFSHLSQQEIQDGKAKIASSEINSYQDVLSSFPKIIHFFDWETGNLKDPYEGHTLAFSAISRGAFQPTAIRDDFEKVFQKGKKVHFSFQLGSKLYAAELKNDGDWLDPAFMEVIEKAMLENRTPGKIYYCQDGGQAAGYIFLTTKQYEVLQKEQSELFPK